MDSHTELFLPSLKRLLRRISTIVFLCIEPFTTPRRPPEALLHWKQIGVELDRAKTEILKRTFYSAYVSTMSEPRNNQYGDFVQEFADKWAVVLVGSIGNTISRVYPYEDPRVPNEDLAVRIIVDGQNNGALFDLYLEGYFYSLTLNNKEFAEIRGAEEKNGENVLVDVMARRIGQLRDQHHTFYFRDENPVDGGEAV